MLYSLILLPDLSLLFCLLFYTLCLLIYSLFFRTQTVYIAQLFIEYKGKSVITSIHFHPLYYYFLCATQLNKLLIHCLLYVQCEIFQIKLIKLLFCSGGSIPSFKMIGSSHDLKFSVYQSANLQKRTQRTYNNKDRIHLLKIKTTAQVQRNYFFHIK